MIMKLILTAPKLFPGNFKLRLKIILANDETTQPLKYIAVNSSGPISPHGWITPRLKKVTFTINKILNI